MKYIEYTHKLLSKKFIKWSPGIDSIWSPKWILVALMYIFAIAFMAKDPWYGSEMFSWNQGFIVILLSFLIVTTICFEWNFMGKAEGINLILQLFLIFPFALFLGRIIGKPIDYSIDTTVIGIFKEAVQFTMNTIGLSSFIPKSFQEIFTSPSLAILFIFICAALSFGKKKSSRIGLLLTALIVPLVSTLAYQPRPSFYFFIGCLFLAAGAAMQSLDVNSYVCDINIIKRLKHVMDEAERRSCIRITKRAIEEEAVSEKTVCEIIRRCYSNNSDCNPETIPVITRAIAHRLIHEHGLLNISISSEGIFLIPTNNIFVYDSLLSEVALWPRSLVLAIIAIIWWLSPIDIIPDSIPFIGTVDDFIILFLAGAPLFKQLASKANTTSTKFQKQNN